MDIYNIIKFTNRRRDLIKYVLLLILCLIFFDSKYYLYVLTSILGYMVYISYYRLDIFKKYKSVLDTLDFKDLKWINRDIIIKYYINLLKYREFNELAFENSIQNMNEFLRLRSLDYTNNYSDIIQNAKYRRNRALNELLSISINIDLELVQRLQDICTDLKNATDRYIIEMEQKYKKNSDILICDLQDPENNPNTDVLYTNSFNIY